MPESIDPREAASGEPEPLAQALAALLGALDDQSPLPAPPPALNRFPDLRTLYTRILDLRAFVLALADGDLSASTEQRGCFADTLKSLQASLRHLTWQAERIAAGDLSQRVAFMGQFSEAFNAMVESLAQARIELTRRNEELGSEVKAHRAAEAALQDSEALHRRLLESAPHPVMISRLEDGRVLLCNQRAADLFGIPRDAATGAIGEWRASDFYMNPEDRDRLAGALAAEGSVSDFDAWMHTVEGRALYASISASTTTYCGEPAVHSAFSDLTARKRIEEQLRVSEELHRTVFDLSPEGIVVTDITGRIWRASASALAMFGVQCEDQMLGDHLADTYVESEDRERARDDIARLALGGQLRAAEYSARRATGEPFVVELSGEAMADAEGAMTGFVLMARDVTDRRVMEDQLRFLSFHDKLTGLYNRRFFEEELARLALSRLFPVSIVSIDVDGLKKANDSLGHVAGDRLLTRLAGTLQGLFRQEDVVARIGGDEFSVLLPGMSAQTAEQIAARLAQKVAEANAASSEPPVSISIGVATADNAAGLHDAVVEADRAMYAEKAARAAARNEAAA